MSSSSPMGNQDKYYNEDTGCWYKADYLGYEGLSEYVVSELLKRSKIRNEKFQFVQYGLCSFQMGKKKVTGCYSRNFIGPAESELTLFRFFKMYYGIDVTVYTVGMSVAEQIEFVASSVEKVTGLPDFGAYLTLLLELDAFVLNDDRHYRNITILRDDDGRFLQAPVFDNGGALLSDEYSYTGEDLEELIRSVKAKPFSRDFDEQLDVAESMYGVQIEFPGNLKFLNEIKPEILGYYTEEQLRQAEYVLRHSFRKYSYLVKRLQAR